MYQDQNKFRLSWHLSLQVLQKWPNHKKLCALQNMWDVAGILLSWKSPWWWWVNTRQFVGGKSPDPCFVRYLQTLQRWEKKITSCLGLGVKIINCKLLLCDIVHGRPFLQYSVNYPLIMESKISGWDFWICKLCGNIKFLCYCSF